MQLNKAFRRLLAQFFIKEVAQDPVACVDPFGSLAAVSYEESTVLKGVEVLTHLIYGKAQQLGTDSRSHLLQNHSFFQKGVWFLMTLEDLVDHIGEEGAGVDQHILAGEGLQGAASALQELHPAQPGAQQNACNPAVKGGGELFGLLLTQGSITLHPRQFEDLLSRETQVI